MIKLFENYNEFDHYWYWKSKLPERSGEKCKVISRGGRMNTVVVEFMDGYKVATSRHAVRKITPFTKKFLKK